MSGSRPIEPIESHRFVHELSMVCIDSLHISVAGVKLELRFRITRSAQSLATRVNLQDAPSQDIYRLLDMSVTAVKVR
jgi:hypothetical protein